MAEDDHLKEAMEEAIRLARESKTPFGAVLIDRNFNVVTGAANSTTIDGPMAHAEINLLHRAWNELRDLRPYALVSTCEPCPMCMGAIIWHGIKKVHFGASIGDAAVYLHQIPISANEIAERSGGKIEIRGGLMREDCIEMFEAIG